MSDLYTVNEQTHTLTTRTCTLEENEVHNNGTTPYEEIILDLCRCMCAAIESDDDRGKHAIGAALHTVLSSVLDLE